MHPASIPQLLLVKADVIVHGRVADRVVLGEIRLENDFTSEVAASSASRDLREQLERSFRGAEVWQSQRVVCANNANECDSMNVVSFGNHLGANQHVEFARVELVEHALEIVTRANCVAIEPTDTGIRK